ncbi:DUF805 domain-containing protein [Brevundimonas sp. VNH65]|uniref:DUF805 domain-containing protein n=1 Tax=Brevundimonas sp. VNH65 TaxID=3400917 RepID=UPI003BFBEBBF
MLMLRPLLRYADFSGRARRAEYWGFMLFQFGLYLLCLIMLAASLGSARENPSGAFLGMLFWFGVIGLMMLGFALPNYAVLARRLHDIGKSALWMALILPGVVAQFVTISSAMRMARTLAEGGLAGGDVNGAALAAAGGSTLISLIALLCNLVLFVMTLLPGQTGPNRFGPDPKDPDAVAPTPAAGGLTGYDEARLEELFAQARREQGAATPGPGAAAPVQPYRPVFDFSPGATEPMRTDIPAAAWDPAPAAAFEAAPQPFPAQAFPTQPFPTPAPAAQPAYANPPFGGDRPGGQPFAGAALDPAFASARPFGRRGA